MREYFWIDGERCDDYGIHLQGPMTFSSTQANVETFTVPGRNGDLHVYDGSYQNIAAAVRCFALDPNDVSEATTAIKRWSLLQRGYRRLEVSNEPGYFRLAAVTSGPETEIRMRRLAPFTLSFDCQPQKYLVSGEREITILQSGAKLRNVGFPALPLITAYGNGAGTIAINGVTVQIKSMSEYLTIDSEMQNAYKGATLQNSVVYAPEFPVFENGMNEVTFSGDVERLVIKPRWWEL